MRCIDINCDMGEGMSNDRLLMPFISSANIACGYHAGNTEIIKQTISLCLERNVAIGAHPSFDDRAHFGRVEMHLTDSALSDLIIKQLDIFTTIATELGAVVHHVKPHGSLYNMAAKNATIAAVIANAVLSLNAGLTVYGLANGCLINEARRIGLKTAAEAFADRSYEPDGTLTPRSKPYALHNHTGAVVTQALQIASRHQVTATNGEVISLGADTICIHGDGMHALEFAQAIHAELAVNKIRITAVR